MMLEIQNDYENPPSNAESELRRWKWSFRGLGPNSQLNGKKKFHCLICDSRFARKDENWDKYLNEQKRPTCDKFSNCKKKATNTNFKTHLKSSRGVIYLFIMIDFSYWRRAMVLSGLVPSVRVSSEQRLLRQRFPTSQASLIKYIPHFPVWKQKTWRIWLIICYPILGFFNERTILL